MKILQLTKKFPYPLKDGESIAVSNLTQALVAQGCNVTLLSMNTIKHQVNVESLRNQLSYYDDIKTVYLDNRVSVFGAIGNLFSSESYHVSRFDYQEFRDALVDILQNDTFDIIQLETLYLAPYIELIRVHSKAKIVMRSHNVEFEIWKRTTSTTRNLLKRLYLNYLTKKLQRYEVGQLSQYDLLVTVTEKDLDNYRLLGYSGKGLASPISVDISNYQPQELSKDQALKLSFIGSLDWAPNLDGLDWFLRDIWPSILKRFPFVELHVAGRNCPKRIADLASSNIFIHGEVGSAIDFINAYPITIVPLLSGSGMRVKILEGMALGRVVISTTIGAEGISASHGKEMYYADNAKQFVSAVEEVSINKQKMVALSTNARRFIQHHFDRNTNAQRLISEYQELITTS